MKTIYDLTRNYTLHCAVLGWVIAQFLKMLYTLLATGRFDLERLFGSGGMPSSHSAMVCALAVSTARAYGVGSPVFSVAFILACVVMYDAMGVRRAAGEHAKIINEVMDFLKMGDSIDKDTEEDKELKEKLGHTPLEVLGGALLGILIAVLIPIY